MTKPVDPAAFAGADPFDPDPEFDPAGDPFAAIFPEGVPDDVRAKDDPLAFDPVTDWMRKPGWTVERQRAFIAALAETGSVIQAAETAGVTARSAYRLRLRPGAEAFRAAWAHAQRLAVETLTSVAFDRAIHGAPRSVWANGRKIGEEWVPSDRLLVFLLRHLDSRRYGNLSGLLPVHVPDPLDGAREGLPAATAVLTDQPIPPDRDMYEQFELCQHFPDRR